MTVQQIVDTTNNAIELLIYMIGDCESSPTEDEVLNHLIGMQVNLKYQYKQLIQQMECE